MQLPLAYPALNLQATIKQFPMDFQVIEELGWEPSGSGEHVFLWIRKQHCNSLWLAEQLAKLAKVPKHHVGIAGLKDRHAVTSQWFSIYLANKAEPNWHDIESDNVELHKITRHTKKLRRGVHEANRFILTLRDIDLDQVDWQQRLQLIATQGFPNYFGPQRFGRNGENLDKTLAMFAEPKRKHRISKSLALSTARSYLFNQMLAERIHNHRWHTVEVGDVAMFANNHSIFTVSDDDIHRQDILPCASLFGTGESLATGLAADIEQTVIQQHPQLANGLLQQKVSRQWRPLREHAYDLTWYAQGNSCLRLEFRLRRGCYATVMLRELANISHNEL